MQETLAKRKVAEEKAKREEEERLRREEEERLKKEEEEKKAEEAKRRKKEREKEKLQKKRQEGKLLSAKQKAEAHRLEAIRNQILSNAGGLPLSTSNASAPTKRPLYQEKKSKPAYYQANGAASAKVIENAEERESQEILTEEHSMEPEYVEYSGSVEEKSEVAKENGMEDEDEWDAKSWDDISLSVSAFADEEVDSESKPIVKKEPKKPVSDSHKADRSADNKPAVYAKKPVPVEPIRENKRMHAEVGTPICISQREFFDIGRSASIENNQTPVDISKKGQKVAIKIVGSNPEEQQKMFGRHFELEDELVSHISRRSIHLLKANYQVIRRL